ncbi:CBL-interacting serine/threonine-protein kinase 6 [Hibiscus syriacus]|uniref:CBL-interacting serine/threonine-protein kinase 6 n=1 Tax=Hibiscus syriacus TaxID=106335 RepID=A0A6A2XFQ0_HIBSY|nr:CBL-interacting serine/threonine-protein kinase 6 [Hibiscus syriacus]
MKRASLRRPELCRHGKRSVRRRDCHLRAWSNVGSWNLRESVPCPEHRNGEERCHESRRQREGYQSRDDGADKARNLGHEDGEAPHIVELHEVMASKTKIYFAMELVRGGELFTKVAKGRLDEDTARYFHRSLETSGLLHELWNGLSLDVIGKKGYDGSKADIWSCGVILYVLLTGFLPFQDDNLIAVYRKIYRGDFKCPPWFSSEARRDSNCRRCSRRRGEKKRELRFATTEPANSVIETRRGGQIGEVQSQDKRVESEIAGRECGRKGKLAVSADIFAVTPSLLVVEVKKDNGDTLEYNQFSKELRPALKDIVWTSAADNSTFV